MSSAIAFFITLAIAGIVDAGYLTWKHFYHKSKALVCPLDHDCSKVTESKWSHLFGVRNEVLGLLFYVIMLMAGVAMFVVPKFSQLKLFVIIATAISLLISLLLLWVQLYKVKDYCFYCMLSALINLLLFVNSFFL